MTYGNGATESFSYNDRLQLTQQSLVKNSSVIQQYEYGYGVVNLNDGVVDTSKNTGQLARVDGFIGGSPSSPTKQYQQRYSYDSIGRLERAKEVRGDNSQLVWESKFSYDRFGNRYRKTSENPNSLPFVAVEETDVDKATNRISTNTTYDEAGNTTTDSKFRNRQYRYDANGRMVWTQATSGGNDSTAVYDALGQRIATKVNNTWKYVVYDIGGKMVAEYGQSSTATDKIRYILLDRQGSTRTILNQSATVLARFDYQPFGEEIASGVGQRTTLQGYGGSDSSRQRYALTERDEATGLDHTWWRKYENTAGRWTSSDPYRGSMKIGDPQSFNRYSYVQNDPMNFIDPIGLCTFNINYNASYFPNTQDGQRQQARFEAEIIRIFRQAGQDVVFNNPSAASGTSRGSFTINLNATNNPTNPGAPGSTRVINGQVQSTGNAYARDLRASIETETTQAYKALALHPENFAVGLARVGAHEAGHYFLNINTNTAHTDGLMREGFTGSTWSLPTSAGSFQFTRLQALLLSLRCSRGPIETNSDGLNTGPIPLRQVSPPSGFNPGSGNFNLFRLLDLYHQSLGSGGSVTVSAVVHSPVRQRWVRKRRV
jgi:RHS repeat-associated protein